MTRRGRALPFVATLLAAAGCGGGDEPGAPADDLALAVLTDTNPDPRVVEVELAASPASAELLGGVPSEVWAFRDAARAGSAGLVPGPMLEANQGDEVVVHFGNELSEETTIHWHGVRLDAAMDGTPASQVPIPPGGSFEYRFVVPDAGLFWFHPHVRGDVQIERGLYAPLLVRGGTEIGDVDADRVLVFDDVLLDADGGFPESNPLDLMLGRQGNVLLVNGRSSPVLRARAGARERWRVLDTANGRFFQLAAPGLRFLVIGWDGGMLPEPYETESLLIAPGERYDVLVTLPDTPGETLPLQSLYYDRGHEIPDTGPADLLTIALEGPAPAPGPLPVAWGEVEPVPWDAATAVRSFELSELMEGVLEPEFFINGERFPDVTPTAGALGDVELWEVINATEMDHPFHLHGLRFQALTGPASGALGWKDTVLVPRDSTVRLAVPYDAPGEWMYHCHILEHAERGMMNSLIVTAP